MQGKKILWAYPFSSLKYNQLLLKLLQTKNIQVSLLIFSHKNISAANYSNHLDRSQSVEQSSRFLSSFLKRKKFFFLNLCNFRWRQLWQWLKPNHDIYLLDPLLNEVIWRQILCPHFIPTTRKLFMDKQFYFADKRLKKNGELKFKEFDCVITDQNIEQILQRGEIENE